MTLVACVHTLSVVTMQLDLKTAREKRGWDQKTLATKSGVDQSTISRIEAGVTTNPANATVARLEDTLKLKRGSLVFGADAEALAS